MALHRLRDHPENWIPHEIRGEWALFVRQQIVLVVEARSWDSQHPPV